MPLARIGRAAASYWIVVAIESPIMVTRSSGAATGRACALAAPMAIAASMGIKTARCTIRG